MPKTDRSFLDALGCVETKDCFWEAVTNKLHWRLGKGSRADSFPDENSSENIFLTPIQSQKSLGNLRSNHSKLGQHKGNARGTKGERKVMRCDGR